MPLGQRSDCGDARYAGIEIPFTPDIADQLEVIMLHCHAGWDIFLLSSNLHHLASPAMIERRLLKAVPRFVMMLVVFIGAAYIVRWLRFSGCAADTSAVPAASHRSTTAGSSAATLHTCRRPPDNWTVEQPGGQVVHCSMSTLAIVVLLEAGWNTDAWSDVCMLLCAPPYL